MGTLGGKRLRSYQKMDIFLYYVFFFAVQSESEIRFFAVEPINTLFFMFFWFVCMVRLGYFRLG